MLSDEQSQDWSLDALTALPDETLMNRTRQAVGSLSVSRLYLGRCMLALEHRWLSFRTGYSGARHVLAALGVHRRTARQSRRVALDLEELPLLRAAAEQGLVPWTALRAIVTKATAETETDWMALATQLSSEAIERLSARTKVGAHPRRTPDDPPESDVTRLTLELAPEVLLLFQERLQQLSREAGRVVGQAEGFLLLLAGSDEALAAARERLAASAAVVEREIEALPEVPSTAIAATEVKVTEEVTLVRALRFSGTARVVTPAQREFLFRRDGYVCQTPCCSNRIWLHIHHIAFYCRGGATLPENLVLLCSRCHSNVHAGWLRISGQAPHALTFTDADGAPLLGRPTSGAILSIAGPPDLSGCFD